MATTLAAPLYIKESTEAKAVLTTQQLSLTDTNGAVVGAENTMYLGALAILAAGIAIYSLFSYKNRKLQMWLGFANTLLIAGFAFTTFYVSTYNLEPMLDPKAVGSRGWGFYLPMVALVLNMMANRLIQRDERLVRSMDRIR